MRKAIKLTTMKCNSWLIAPDGWRSTKIDLPQALGPTQPFSVVANSGAHGASVEAGSQTLIEVAHGGFSGRKCKMGAFVLVWPRSAAKVQRINDCKMK